MDDPTLLSNQVYQSEAYQIYLRLHNFSVNHYVFAKNYEEIKELLLAAESSETFHLIWAQDKQQEMLQVTRELMRRFHNYLASAKMLIDHTRTLVNENYADSPFIQEYQAEVQSQFIGNPLSGFIEDLRNYALHFQLPFTAGRIKPADGKNAQRFILHTDQLMAWSKWTSKGKPYLESSGEEIVVTNLIDEYFNCVNNFHKWVSNRIEEIHKDELQWLEEMENRIQDALKKLRNGIERLE